MARLVCVLTGAVLVSLLLPHTPAAASHATRPAAPAPPKVDQQRPAVMPNGSQGELRARFLADGQQRGDDGLVVRHTPVPLERWHQKGRLGMS